VIMGGEQQLAGGLTTLRRRAGAGGGGEAENLRRPWETARWARRQRLRRSVRSLRRLFAPRRTGCNFQGNWPNLAPRDGAQHLAGGLPTLQRREGPREAAENLRRPWETARWARRPRLRRSARSLRRLFAPRRTGGNFQGNWPNLAQGDGCSAQASSLHPPGARRTPGGGGEPSQTFGDRVVGPWGGVGRRSSADAPPLRAPARPARSRAKFTQVGPKQALPQGTRRLQRAENTVWRGPK
jgi:hypothetical protein